MTSQQLPERPNLEQLKKQAKSLLHAAQAKEAPALGRFQALPAFARKSADEIAGSRLALHDAQSVIAREHGYPSWVALREAVEERTLSFAAAAAEFVRSAVGGATGRARRLLALHPGIARASLHPALVLGDVRQVEERLKSDPDLAKRQDGPETWEPIQYVCQSRMGRDNPSVAQGLVDVATLLLARGANANAEYHWKWHPELPRTVLWGALCTVEDLKLAEALLKAGARPTDGVCLQILASASNRPALDLLLAYGAEVNGIPGGVPPLRYILGYARDPSGAFWLLEHGANANLAWGERNEAPIHVAARRWDIAMMEALVQQGADVALRRDDGLTAHSLAELNGNHEVAQWLLAHGAQDELSEVDRFAAACARGDQTLAGALLQARPALKGELRHEHHLLLHRMAERGDAAVLRVMLEHGFDARVRDRDQVTPLHRAAMAGRPECVKVLLAHGASPNDRDGMFAAPPLVWAVEGSNHAQPGADFPAAARLLIDAGTDDWIPDEETPQVEGTLEKLAELRRAAEAL